MGQSDRKYKLMIAQFPGGNATHPDPAVWVAQMLPRIMKDPRISEVMLCHKSDTPITMVRNQVVEHSLIEQCDYLLMIDSDMKPDLYANIGAPLFWDTSWNFLMRYRDKSPDNPPATIAAPYCGPPDDEEVYIFEWANRQSNNPNPDMRLKMIERNRAAMSIGVEPVAALPTGLILYDMRVFENLPRPWFQYERDSVSWLRKASTEDVYQTRNANILGMPQFVNWDCWAGHWKLKCVGKPQILTVDSVAEDLRAALLRGFRADDRIKYIMPD